MSAPLLLVCEAVRPPDTTIVRYRRHQRCQERGFRAPCRSTLVLAASETEACSTLTRSSGSRWINGWRRHPGPWVGCATLTCPYGGLLVCAPENTADSLKCPRIASPSVRHSPFWFQFSVIQSRTSPRQVSSRVCWAGTSSDLGPSSKVAAPAVRSREDGFTEASPLIRMLETLAPRRACGCRDFPWRHK